MVSTNQAYIRHELAPREPAPKSTHGIAHWMKVNLFATPTDAILTLFGLLIVVYFLPSMLNWLFFDAVWSGENRTACLTIAQGGIQPDGWSGACWAFVEAKYQQFIYGRYPEPERWRVDVTGVIFALLLVALMVPKIPYKIFTAVAFFIIFPIVAYILLSGGWFGLPHVETPLWGGLLVTLVLSFVGIAVSLPMGVILALARRSNMPVIKAFSIIFIEIVRGVPLVTVLFMASVMLPLFLPQGVTFDKLLRALIGVALFASAYMAEVIRGGLQAIPKGQYEGADALGLSYWHKTGLIVLPQALKLVIPGIVNTFIGLFKDTSLVYIIGMFDLLGIVRQNFSDANWASPQTPTTGLIFAGFVFWIFCFGMSRYSIYMEKRLDTGQKS